MLKQTTRLAACLAAAVTLAGGAGAAETYPSRPIRIVTTDTGLERVAQINGVAVLNLNAQYTPQPGWTLTGQINNLLDRHYTTAAVLAPNAFNGNTLLARPFAATDNGDYPLRHGTFYAPGAPRNVWLGVRYAWR